MNTDPSENNPPSVQPSLELSRRAAMTGAAIAATTLLQRPAAAALPTTQAAPPARCGRIRQSIVHWCFASYWDVPTAARIAKQLGCESLELVHPKFYPVLKSEGLRCAIGKAHGFVQGMNNPKFQPDCLEKLREAIDVAADSDGVCDRVITFTGMRDDIPADVGMKNCIEGYKQIIGHAEKKKITLCLEMLNSRVNQNMKGHPGYQGDHTDYCIELIKRVGSPRLKLLFDIYHVQIMDGDVISRIRQHHEFIGHVHTAGVPGRGELDERQEVNYPPIMRALLDVGYDGFVGQEFMPTRNPQDGLREAIALCDV